MESSSQHTTYVIWIENNSAYESCLIKACARGDNRAKTAGVTMVNVNIVALGQLVWVQQWIKGTGVNNVTYYTVRDVMLIKVDVQMAVWLIER